MGKFARNIDNIFLQIKLRKYQWITIPSMNWFENAPALATFFP
jgi:hypothetical protein